MRVSYCDGYTVNIRSFFFFQEEDGIRDLTATGVQTCALPISSRGLLDELIVHAKPPRAPRQFGHRGVALVLDPLEQPVGRERVAVAEELDPAVVEQLGREIGRAS